MIKRIKQHKNYVVTFGIEILILFLGFLVFRIANQRFDDYGFSEYTLARRSLSFVQPLLMIGLGVAIPRFVSLEPNRISFFPSAIILVFISSTVIFIGLTIFDELWATVFFGSKDRIDLIYPLGFLLLAYSLHALVYGYLRGRHNVYFANLIQLINIGLVPILVLYSTTDISTLLFYLAIVVFGTSTVSCITIFYQYGFHFNFSQFAKDRKSLMNYGLPRVFGDFALLAILTLPTYIVLNTEKDILLGGDIAYTITLLNIAGAAFGPISIVLLPEIANFMRENDKVAITKRFNFFLTFSIFLTIVGYAVFYFFAEDVLQLLLGPGYRHNILPSAKIVLLASFGYITYIVLRSFLDALKVRASNAINLTLSLLVYLIGVLVVWYLDLHWNYYLWLFVASATFLGIITLIQTKRTIKLL